MENPHLEKRIKKRILFAEDAEELHCIKQERFVLHVALETLPK